MTKSIEQIALEVSLKMSSEHKWTSFANHEEWEEYHLEFLRRCLAKIGEGLEPRAFKVEGFDDFNRLFAHQLFFDLQEARELASSFAKHYPIIKTSALYATPHEAIIAAEQRVLAVLPDDFSESKDWKFDSDPVARIEWLKSFHIEHKRQIDELHQQLESAEQGVAEACARLLYSEHMPEDAAEAIRSGEWRNYL